MHKKLTTTSLLTFIFLLLTLLQLTNAAPAASDNLPRYEPGVLYLPDKAIALDDGYELSIQGVLGAIVIIICGIMLGVRSIWDRTPAGRNTQSLTGFVTFGFITWIMLANFEPSGTYGQNRLTIYFIVPFVVGCISIFFMAVTIQLYLMLIGGLGGLAMGLWILGWKENLSITSTYGRAILLTVLVVVFMVLSLYSCFWHKLGAAFAGPYLFFMGLDIFFHTGFLYCFTTTLDTNPNHGKLSCQKRSEKRETRKAYFFFFICLVSTLLPNVSRCLYHAILSYHRGNCSLCYSRHWTCKFVVLYYRSINDININSFLLLLHQHHIFRQHSVVMGTLLSPDYNYKSNIRTGYLPPFPTWRPPFFHRSAAPPPPPVAVPATAVV
jgi:hypothetical protein